jgi:phosphoribosylformimino-5-aminoimidazole carboxamide ribotide isomerase
MTNKETDTGLNYSGAAKAVDNFIVPAIDIIDGKCVRLTKGDFSQKKIYHETPLEVAKQFEDAGLKRLHLVDLDGARTGQVKNWKVLEQIAAKTSLVIDFSGGISTEKNLQITFNSGAKYATIGSIAVKDELAFSSWLMAYGPERFIVAADVKNEIVAINGWAKESNIGVFDLIEKYKLKGVKQFLCTDVNKDGLLQGPATSLYKKILNQHPSADLIASGGIATIDDLNELREAGCHAAIIGKALYENKISLADLKRFL